AFYLLDRPYPVEQAKPIAERLKSFAHCDHGTVDLSHVWRIPGTPNWPNAKKIAEGRPPEPQQAVVAVPWNRGFTPLKKLDTALPQPQEEAGAESKSATRGSQQVGADISVELLIRQLPGRLRKMITQPGADRSKALFAVIKGLASRGCGAELIERIVRGYPI